GRRARRDRGLCASDRTAHTRDSDDDKEAFHGLVLPSNLGCILPALHHGGHRGRGRNPGVSSVSSAFLRGGESSSQVFLRISSFRFQHQNWNRTANSAWRDGALMFGSSDVLVPNSGRPVVASLPAPMLLFGMLKLARFNTLKSCAISSARVPPSRKNFEKRRSTLAKPGQATSLTGVRLRAVLNELIASRLSDRQP